MTLFTRINKTSLGKVWTRPEVPLWAYLIAFLAVITVLVGV